MADTFKAKPNSYSSLWMTLLENKNFKESFTQCMQINIDSAESISFINNLPATLCSNGSLVEVLANCYLLPLHIKKLRDSSEHIHKWTFLKFIATAGIFGLILVGILIRLLLS